MAREYISLVSDEVKKEATLESRIKSGELNPDNFHELSPEDQRQVNNILFKMASDKIDIHHGTSALEFVVMSALRLMTKRIDGLALSEEDQKIQKSLNAIMNMHDLANPTVPMDDWLFDYMAYAQHKTYETLQNRKDHIDRKVHTTGTV